MHIDICFYNFFSKNIQILNLFLFRKNFKYNIAYIFLFFYKIKINKFLLNKLQ